MDFRSKLIVILASILLHNLAWSAELKEQPLSDYALEKRSQNIFSVVRCMACQGEAIKDSNATLSKAMRQLIRQKISSGESDEQVLSFIRERYGDYAVLAPSLQMNTVMLWLLPASMLLIGIWLHLSRRQVVKSDQDRIVR